MSAQSGSGARVRARAVRTRAIAATVAALTFACALAPGAARAADERLTRRLDTATAEAVGRLVDRALAEGLPGEPLVATALEGASQRAGGRRIAAAVQRELADLERARAVLGESASGSELVAAATALRAGIPPDTLARLRALVHDRTLVVPLVVLADLVARGVPADHASAGLGVALRSGMPDAGLLRMREQVASDIRGGMAPNRAIELRARAVDGDGPARPVVRAVPGAGGSHTP